MDAALANALQAQIDDACRRGGLCAASLALHTDGQVHAFAAGLANAREDISANPDTLFHIGSVTKAITAELVWRQILEGRLSADTPVIDAAPELAHIATLADPRLTIGHLLSHTGGLDGDIVFDAGRGPDVLQRFLARIAAIGSLAPPGVRFSYANVGYNILARILERRVETPFEDLLRTLLHETHGLTQVAILPEEKLRHRTAVLFTAEGRGWSPVAFGPHSNIGSGTVLAMSMPDLARWGAALASSSDIVGQMTRPAIALPYSHRYAGWGFGVTLFDGMGQTVFGHDGGTAGTTTFLRVAPRSGATWAFSATGPEALAVFRALDGAIRADLGLSPAASPKTQVAPADLAPYEGDYLRHGMSLSVRRANAGGLVLSTGGDLPILDGLQLRPLSSEVFEAEIASMGGAKIWLSFHEFDPDGRPRLLYALERLARRAEAMP
ncbi:serine hydrolase domain-containing protein [Phenylobacterium sp.]|uniref:serine hydrolase domain-containing protein n=1 Tax=Phenylobacterium sp. TaxID=1871053 RepID=UPI0028A039BD|nr:serine hydrolase domain-containing protein [Phenylobacterium sp.]